MVWNNEKEKIRKKRVKEKKVKVLVLVQAYPNGNKKDLMYVHTRNLFYQKNGIDVTVMNFSASSSYRYESIRVISEKEFVSHPEQYDTFIVHAANVRNHYRFLKKWERFCSKIVFFFHGHEILRLSEEYPKDYDYIQSPSRLHILKQDLYDSFKFQVFRKYYRSVAEKSMFIFVSEWMRKKFFQYLCLNSTDIMNHDVVISNSVGEIFEEESYLGRKEAAEYDFVTIRGNIDGSKYCVDLVNGFAKKYPEYRFLLVGNGKFFDYHEKASNLTWINAQLGHEEIPSVLNNSRCALMLTRTDAQGVMACEMATYGIPTIVSDIEICRDVFSCYTNVSFLKNDIHADLKQTYNNLLTSKDLHEDYRHYLREDTLDCEVKLIKSL